MRMAAGLVISSFVLAACNGGPAAESARAESANRAASAPAAATASAAPVTTATAAGGSGSTALHFGGPVTAPVVKLSDVAKDPAAYKAKTFATTGTVTSVCKMRGCWMEIKDDSSQAHIKMAGESFFVPKTSAGRTAKVQGTLVSVPTAEEADCNEEAAKQMGHEVAKMQLIATGVELE